MRKRHKNRICGYPKDQKNGMNYIGCRCSQKLHDQCETTAQRYDLQMSQLIRRALRHYLHEVCGIEESELQEA